jgi:hypothetical protein
MHAFRLYEGFDTPDTVLGDSNLIATMCMSVTDDYQGRRARKLCKSAPISARPLTCSKNSRIWAIFPGEARWI